jgi:hypothetical protein
MPLHDYKCRCGLVTERLTHGEDTILCECGETAHKVGIYPICYTFSPAQEGLGPKYHRFREASAEIDHTCSRFESETNAKVPDLKLWQQARSNYGNRRRHPGNEASVRKASAV